MLRPKFAADLIVAAVVLLIAGAVLAIGQPWETVGREVCDVNTQLSTTDVKVGGSIFKTEVASSSADKQRGLSGRNCIDSDRAMIFPYYLTGDYCFWMKDMNFNIDMVWLDDDKKIINTTNNVSPGSYPEQFCPEKPALYILEFDAGVVSENDWQPGTEFIFSL